MYERTILGNKLPVLTGKMPDSRSVTVCIFVGAGSRYETDDIAGASHFLEHMLFKGTKRWKTARAISEAIEGVGGMFNAATDRELTVYWVKIARPFFSRALEVLADMILHPVMDATELEKERRVITEELNMSKDHPAEWASLNLETLLWPNQPMGRDVGGSKETVAALPRDTVIEYMRNQYKPNNSAVVVTGDIEHAEVVSAVEGHLHGWKKGGTLDWFRAVKSKKTPRVRVEYRKTDQAHLFLGLNAYHTEHPDRYALDMLSTVLGEGMSSRMFYELREKRGLVYDVHSSVSHFRDTGAYVVSSGVDPKRASQALAVIAEELEKVKDGVTKKELTKAKEFTKGRLLLRTEDTRAIAMWLGGQQLLRSKVMTLDDVLAKVDAVTVDDVVRVAKDLFDRNRYCLSIIGPFRSETSFVKAIGVKQAETQVLAAAGARGRAKPPK